MRIFDFENYRTYLNHAVKSRPRSGRGELSKLAGAAQIHTSTLSQILRGDKHLTPEQACLVAEHFGLKEAESDYFLLLVLKERASSPLLIDKLNRQIRTYKEKASDLKNIITNDRELTLEDKAIFYSAWYYTAIWALTSIAQYQTREAVKEYFSLPLKLVNEVLDFLIKIGLCSETSGQLTCLSTYVHIEASSPLVARHHANWRIKAMEKHTLLGRNELAYTSPMTLSQADAAKIRALLVDVIGKSNEIRAPSECEELYFLNIDWLRV